MLVVALDADPVRVYCDNGTDEDVVVAIDGRHETRVSAHDVRAIDSSMGEHVIAARGAAGVVDEQRFSADRRGGFDGRSFVLNIAGASRYGIYSRVYTDLPSPSPPPAAFEPGGHLFAMPDGVGAELFGVMPETVRLPSSEHSRTERRLYHLPIHADRPCCARAR